MQWPLGFLAGGAGGGNGGEKAAVNSSPGSRGFFGLILVTRVEVGRDGDISTAPPLKAGHRDLQVPPLLAFSSTWTCLGGGLGGDWWNHLGPREPSCSLLPPPGCWDSPDPLLPAPPPFQPCISQCMPLRLFELQLLKLFAF